MSDGAARTAPVFAMTPALAIRVLVPAAIVAVLAVVASGFGARFGAWGIGTAFTILRWGGYAALAVAVLALAAAVVMSMDTRSRVVLMAACVAAAIAGAVPIAWMQRARDLPAINDITTDTRDPPAFAAILSLRSGSPVPSAYPGKPTADAQHAAYPDIASVVLAEPPEAAFAKALAAARAAGWTIIASDPGAGRIEATATTPWFGFRDDVVVRVAPDGRGSRVDVRSVSRIGKGDLGANAHRVREFTAAVAAPLR
jgi:uncharacterized protein (DUF1499 family)